MRKKIAMRWRRSVLRRGAKILEEGAVFLSENSMKRA